MRETVRRSFGSGLQVISIHPWAMDANDSAVSWAWAMIVLYRESVLVRLTLLSCLESHSEIFGIVARHSKEPSSRGGIAFCNTAYSNTAFCRTCLR